MTTCKTEAERARAIFDRWGRLLERLGQGPGHDDDDPPGLAREENDADARDQAAREDGDA